MEEKKLKLAQALREEKYRLPEYNIFGERNKIEDYDGAILYLETGAKPKNYKNNDLLMTCIEDLETMFLDYEIN